MTVEQLLKPYIMSRRVVIIIRIILSLSALLTVDTESSYNHLLKVRISTVDTESSYNHLLKVRISTI
jgi:hypothetical protein